MRNESRAASAIMFGGIMFLMMCCTTYTETCLFLFGHEGQATVVRSYETRSRRTTRLTIEYKFTDGDGHERHENATVSRHTPHPGTGGAIAIRYSNGPFRASRLSGHVGWVGLGFAVVGLGLIAYGFAALGLARPVERRKRKRRSNDDSADEDA